MANHSRNLTHAPSLILQTASEGPQRYTDHQAREHVEGTLHLLLACDLAMNWDEPLTSAQIAKAMSVQRAIRGAPCEEGRLMAAFEVRPGRYSIKVRLAPGPDGRPTRALPAGLSRGEADERDVTIARLVPALQEAAE